MTSEFDQTGFLRMQLQPKLGKPFPECLQTRLCLVLVLEPHHKVIRIPHHDDLSTAAILPPPLNPQVEHVMQEYVRK